MTLLSDDELVAIVAKDGARWPGPLPTITLKEREMLEAVVRGVRSLVGRDLASMNGVDYEVDEEIRGLVQQVTGAVGAASAYVSAFDTPGRLHGSSAYLYFGKSGSAIDLVTFGGVHELDDVSVEGGLNVLTALAENVHRCGIQASEESQPALYLRSSAHPAEVRRVTKGALAAGRLVGDGSSTSFNETSQLEWDEAELKEFLGVRN